MQRIFDMDKWHHLKAETRLEFPGTRPRRLRIEVNSPDDCRLHLVDEDGEVAFLALVRGRDTIEFETRGKMSLMADGADCFIYTADGELIHSVVEAPESFTKIMERRPRNLELERISYEMQANLNRRLEAQAAELELVLTRRFEARERELASQVVPPSAGSEPPPNGDGNASVPPPSGAGE